MKNTLKSIFIIIFLIAFQIAAHKIFIKPWVSEWGVSQAEVTAKIPNDEKAEFIVATRAITINKPLDNVWLWVNQLGADRSGFFSYYFIEKAMGYYTREPNLVTVQMPEFKVGDVVRGSITPETSLMLYEFPVIDVKTNDYFTMENWGTFQFTKINNHQTRLIIRTYGQDRGSFFANQVDYIAYALHYIMERGTLNGFKRRIEHGEGVAFSPLADLLWFSLIVVSGLFIGLMVFIRQGKTAIAMPFLFSSLWIVTLFILPPSPIYSGALVAITMLSFVFRRKNYK